MKAWLGLIGIVASTSAIAGSPSAKQWRFESRPVWSDEFNGRGKPDPVKWSYDLGGDGWGNNELECYTDSPANASVGRGVLTITARRQQGCNGRPFTSARLVSKHKGDFLYGRIEVRARIPAGRGTWPAIWMLPTDWEYGGWPRSGEIDIMEHVGFDPGRIHVSVHTQAYNHIIGTQKTAIRAIRGATTRFHRYRVDWTPDDIRGFIDGVQVFAFANEGQGPDRWPFDKRFHVMLNLAVGGNWGGKEGIDDAAFPASMQVDYVRVYRLVQP